MNYKNLLGAFLAAALTACAGPKVKPDSHLTDECELVTATAQGEVRRFVPECAKHKERLAKTQIETTSAEEQKIIQEAQRLEAMKLIAIRAKTEVGSPELEDLFSRQLLAALTSADPTIQKLARDVAIDTNVDQAALEAKVEHWNTLRELGKSVCEETGDGTLICGSRSPEPPAPHP